MERQLLVMRHAKSSWDNILLQDFDRPLNERGLRDAPEMAKRIAKHHSIPDYVLCSPAKRTLQTAQLLCDVWDMPHSTIVFEPSIYEAGIEELIKVLRHIPDHVSRALLIGHNPTITSLVGHLSHRFIDHMPTAGVACIHMQLTNWRMVADRCGTLAWFDYPKLH